MEQRNPLSLENLIEACEKVLPGGCQSCPCDASLGSPCFIIRQIAGYADADCRTAQKYLLGLLSHSADEIKFLSFYYLLPIKARLEIGDMLNLLAFEELPKNKNIVERVRKNIFGINKN